MPTFEYEKQQVITHIEHATEQALSQLPVLGAYASQAQRNFAAETRRRLIENTVDAARDIDSLGEQMSALVNQGERYPGRLALMAPTAHALNEKTLREIEYFRVKMAEHIVQEGLGWQEALIRNSHAEATPVRTLPPAPTQSPAGIGLIWFGIILFLMASVFVNSLGSAGHSILAWIVGLILFPISVLRFIIGATL